jgi:hypothetical protein
MMTLIQRKTLSLIDTAPDITTRNYWILKTAIQDKAHPRIIERIKQIYGDRLFAGFDFKEGEK